MLVHVLALVGVLTLLCVTTTTAAEDRALVSTDWLAEHIDDSDVVVFQVAMASAGAPVEYIAGSGLLDYHAVAAMERSGLIVEMQPVEDMVAALRRAGVGSDRHVVLYGTPAHFAARVYMTLDYLGHDRVSVLDGGLDAWRDEGRAVQPRPTTFGVGDFTAARRDNVLVTLDWVRDHLDDSALVLVDARPADEFRGDARSGRMRPGHIPGAQNIYWIDLLESEEMPRLRDLEDVRQRYQAAGATADSVVVSYCYIGMRASYTYLIGKHLGFDTRFFDGSWNEWAAHEDLPAELGESR